MSKKKKKHEEQPPAIPLSMLQVAQQIDPDASPERLKVLLRSVQKWRQSLELGTPFQRTYLLTQADADEIKKHVKPTRGNPEFGDGYKAPKRKLPSK